MPDRNCLQLSIKDNFGVICFLSILFVEDFCCNIKIPTFLTKLWNQYAKGTDNVFYLSYKRSSHFLRANKLNINSIMPNSCINTIWKHSGLHNVEVLFHFIVFFFSFKDVTYIHFNTSHITGIDTNNYRIYDVWDTSVFIVCCLIIPSFHMNLFLFFAAGEAITNTNATIWKQASKTEIPSVRLPSTAWWRRPKNHAQTKKAPVKFWDVSHPPRIHPPLQSPQQRNYLPSDGAPVRKTADVVLNENDWWFTRLVLVFLSFEWVYKGVFFCFVWWWW